MASKNKVPVPASMKVPKPATNPPKGMQSTHAITHNQLSLTCFIALGSGNFEIKQAPGKGVGMFATALIKTGTVIFGEEALFVFKGPFDIDEKMVKRAYNDLPPWKKAIFDQCRHDSTHRPGCKCKLGTLTPISSPAATCSVKLCACTPSPARSTTHAARTRCASLRWTRVPPTTR